MLPHTGFFNISARISERNQQGLLSPSVLINPLADKTEIDQTSSTPTAATRWQTPARRAPTEEGFILRGVPEDDPGAVRGLNLGQTSGRGVNAASPGDGQLFSMAMLALSERIMAGLIHLDLQETFRRFLQHRWPPSACCTIAASRQTAARWKRAVARIRFMAGIPLFFCG